MVYYGKYYEFDPNVIQMTGSSPITFAGKFHNPLAALIVSRVLPHGLNSVFEDKVIEMRAQESQLIAIDFTIGPDFELFNVFHVIQNKKVKRL